MQQDITNSDPVLIELHRLSARMGELVSLARGENPQRSRYVTDSRSIDLTLGERCVALVERLGDLTLGELVLKLGSEHAISAVSRAVKAEAGKGQLRMVSEPVPESHGANWRWRVFMPENVSTIRRAPDQDAAAIEEWSRD